MKLVRSIPVLLSFLVIGALSVNGGMRAYRPIEAATLALAVTYCVRVAAA